MCFSEIVIDLIVYKFQGEILKKIMIIILYLNFIGFGAMNIDSIAGIDSASTLDTVTIYGSGFYATTGSITISGISCNILNQSNTIISFVVSSSVTEGVKHVVFINYLDEIDSIAITIYRVNMIVGNSIASLITPAYVEEYQGLTGTGIWYTESNGGETSSQIWHRFDSLCTLRKPSHVYMEMGANDRTWGDNGKTIDATILYHDSVLSVCRSRGIVLTAGDMPPSVYVPADLAKQANAAVRIWGRLNGVKIATIYDTLIDTINQRVLDVTYGTDGVHPNTTLGRRVLAKKYANASIPNNIYSVTSASLPICLGPGRKIITLIGGGNAQYTTSHRWFKTADAGELTNYTTPISCYEKYLYIKIDSGTFLANVNQLGSRNTFFVGGDSTKIYWPCKDGHIAYADTNRSYGGNTNTISFVHDTEDGGGFIGLIRYALENTYSILGKSILSANAWFKLAVQEPGSCYIKAYPLNKPWGVDRFDEGANQNPAVIGQATWGNRYTFSADNDTSRWGNGRFSLAGDCGSIIDSTYIRNAAPLDTAIPIKITSFIQSLSSGSVNYGVALMSPEINTQVHSRVSTNGKRPYIEITTYNGIATQLAMNISSNDTNYGNVPVSVVLSDSNADTTITITPAVNSHPYLVDIVSGTVDTSSVGSVWTFTLHSDAEAVFYFGPDTHYLSNTPVVNGSITYNPDSIAGYGETIRVYFTVNAGYVGSWNYGSSITGIDSNDVVMYTDSAITASTQLIPITPIITSIKSQTRRDYYRLNCARPGDIITIKLSTDIGDSSVSSAVYLGRDTTGAMQITRWFNNPGSDTDSIWCVVPTPATLNVNYRPIVVSGSGMYSEVRVPVTWREQWILNVKGWVR